jgi:hypothetical protein
MFNKDFLGNFLFILIIALFIYNYIYNKGELDLKCIISKKDGKEYCVRRRKDLDGAADLLSNTITKLEELKKYVNEKYPNDDRVKRINKKFNGTKIKETLPTSKFKAYSENKGETLAFCLNTKNENNEKLMDPHTLLFVAIHELSHIASVSIGHKEEFWVNFKWLLVNAKEAGIHEPYDYKKNPKTYCGMKVTDNPYYDK